jgi:hypothetical protein
MLSALLGWIPVIGPIIQGVTSIASGVFGVETAKITAEVEETKVAAQIIHDTNDDISLRLMRDLALLFPVLWGALIGWDTIVSERWHWLMFHVNDYPKAVGYIPYAAYAFLFGNIGMNIWRRIK